MTESVNRLYFSVFLWYQTTEGSTRKPLQSGINPASTGEVYRVSMKPLYNRYTLAG
uniref:Uncharacterized protein n=1 Tax=Arion vulgaris TaxID=1028688 RepID=A0A0B7AZD4_9EUPU